MKTVKNVLKSFMLVEPSGYSWMFPFYIILSIFLTIVFSGIATAEVLDYVNRRIILRYSNILFNLLNEINMLTIFMTSLFSFKNKNYNIFLLQLPVSKKDVFKAKFILVVLTAALPFLTMIYLLLLNYFTGSNDFINAYVGFCILICCIWFIILSGFIGASSMPSKKFRLIGYLPVIMTVLIVGAMIYMNYIPWDIDDNNYDMYNALGKGFAPVLKVTRVLGGYGGVIAIIVAILLGYFLCVKLPLKFSQKEG